MTELDPARFYSFRRDPARMRELITKLIEEHVSVEASGQDDDLVYVLTGVDAAAAAITEHSSPRSEPRNDHGSPPLQLISKETAMDIALAYREIETASQLLADIIDAHSKSTVPDVRDAFGRPQGGLELGVPNGNNVRRCFQVPWALAQPILEAHIAQKRAKLATLCQKARFELGVDVDLTEEPSA